MAQFGQCLSLLLALGWRFFSDSLCIKALWPSIVCIAGILASPWVPVFTFPHPDSLS
jgi:hypothetical protein